MVQGAEWLDRNNINVETVVGTVAILIVAAILILVLSRVLQRWLSFWWAHKGSNLGPLPCEASVGR